MNLMELFNLYSPSGHEEQTRNYICKHLKKIGIPFNTDSGGNVYSLFYPNKPLLSAHMDTVQRFPQMLFESKKHLIVESSEDGYNYIHSGGSFVIGADDKCGIYAILELLEAFPQTNFLFSTGEEVGAKGAHYFCNTQDLSLVSYGLVLDRHGYYDIVCSNNGYGTKEFENILTAIGEPWAMKPARGIFSDCNVLNSQISCANISIGYENAHSHNEWCCVEGVNHTIAFVGEVLNLLDEKFEAPYIGNHNKYFQTTFDDAFVGV
jgi:putative aminopeptidase FrvX